MKTESLEVSQSPYFVNPSEKLVKFEKAAICLKSKTLTFEGVALGRISFSPTFQWVKQELFSRSMLFCVNLRCFFSP